MWSNKQKVLVLVEGERTDVFLMNRLFSIYKMDVEYEIVPYRTNIYVLYKEMFENSDPEEIDLLQLLKSHETDPERKAIFDYYYSDILLIFDLDPQDGKFSPEIIGRMARYFVESSDMGKLYINYPMVESFFHMASIPDPNYDNYDASIEELKSHKYKKRVQQETVYHEYRKFASSRSECNIVIKQNISKAWKLVTGTTYTEAEPPAQIEILAAQLSKLLDQKCVSVLSTCAFFISEYNPRLIYED